ncbi:DUF4270 family protein [Halosquirtibacter laminarini]|uniref:DUF4270 family protein n=1 Tax=Halosquirtibacter laminarini TaxID=3374600 RepID=UPI0037485A0B
MIIDKLKSKNQILLLLFIAGFAFVSCQEKNNNLGLELIPDDQMLQVVTLKDNNTSDSFYERDSPIRVDEPSACIFGVLNDPLLGQTKGSIATQMRLTHKPEINATSVLDSAVILLSYRSFTGDTLTPQNIVVKELSGSLDKDKAYMSSFDVTSLVSDKVIGNGTFTPHQQMSGADTLTQIARIVVTKEYAKHIISLWDKTDESGNLIYENGDAFVKEVKGIYLEPQNVPSNRTGALITTNGSYSISKGMSTYPVDLRIRMHIYTTTTVPDESTDDENDTKDVQKVISLYSTKYSATVPKMEHNYTGTAVADELGNERGSSKYLYVQPNEGLRSVVKLNILSELKDRWTVQSDSIDVDAPDDNLYGNDKIFINKATLKIHVDTLASEYRTMGVPRVMTLRYIPKDSEDGDLRDNENGAYIAGSFSSSSSSYVFDMTKHVIKYLHDKVENSKMYLIPFNRVASTQRAVLFSNKSEQGIEFELIYVKKGISERN